MPFQFIIRLDAFWVVLCRNNIVYNVLVPKLFMPLFFIVLAQYKTVKMMLPSYVCICWPSVKLNICFLSRRGSVSLLRYKLIIYHWIKYHLFHTFHSFIIHEILPELLKNITNLLSRSRCRFKLLLPKSVKFCQRVFNFDKVANYGHTAFILLCPN